MTPSPAAELLTIRDVLRFAVSRFREAGLVHAHGATTALDEAAYLVLETLHLPVDQLEPFVDARLTLAEREALVALIERRVATRKPGPYLTGRTYIQGVPFRVDERVIVPRSYIGEMLFTDLFGGEGFTWSRSRPRWPPCSTFAPAPAASPSSPRMSSRTP